MFARTHLLTLTLAFVALIALAACGKPAGEAAPADPSATIPPGRDGAFILAGKNAVDHTKKLLGGNVGADLTCASCHIESGRQPGPLSFVGIFGQYPQYSDRTHRVIGLRDRIAECFFYSMNGSPPSYFSHDLIAIEAYIAFLSRGYPVGPATPPAFSYHQPKTTDSVAGKKLYAAQCAMCHGTHGAGDRAAGFPPLWGATSFNDRAGMDRMMPAFVQANMPLGKGGSLTDQQAADVAAYILAQPRPHFDLSHLKDVTPQEAAFFR